MRAALAGFVGDIEQVPTAVSAIKVDGKRAYQRVRDGEEVELQAAAGHRARAAWCTTSGRAGDRLDVDVSVRCSSGTYIRAIARDLGARLGVGGHLTALRRTAVGPYDLAVARTLERAGRATSRCCRSRRPRAPPSRPASSTRRRPPTCASGAPWTSTLAGLTAVFAPDGEFLALYEPRGELRRGPVAVFV